MKRIESIVTREASHIHTRTRNCHAQHRCTDDNLKFQCEANNFLLVAILKINANSIFALMTSRWLVSGSICHVTFDTVSSERRSLCTQSNCTSLLASTTVEQRTIAQLHNVHHSSILIEYIYSFHLFILFFHFVLEQLNMYIHSRVLLFYLQQHVHNASRKNCISHRRVPSTQRNAAINARLPKSQ